MKLPFTSILPGAFASAFPKSPTTGLPAADMGVESRAKMLAPVVPSLTATSDRVAALGRNPNVQPASPALPAPMQAPQRPVQSLPASASPLGGMSPLSLSARSPMATRQMGAGTTNPYSYATGGRSRFDPNRMAEMMVRRRDPRGAQFLMQQGLQQTSQDFSREMFGAQQNAMNQRDAMNYGQGLQMFQMQQDAMAQRDAVNFGQQQQMFQQETARRAGESDLDWQRRQEAEAAQRAAQSIVGGEQLAVPGGTVPIVKRADGTTSMAGGFIPTREPAPTLTPDDIAAARAMGGDVRMKMGDAEVSFPALTPPKPTRLTPVPGQPSQIQGQPAIPDRVFDPYTGSFYEAGKVPGRGAASAAPASAAPNAEPAPDPKARMNALRKRLGLSEL